MSSHLACASIWLGEGWAVGRSFEIVRHGMCQILHCQRNLTDPFQTHCKHVQQLGYLFTGIFL